MSVAQVSRRTVVTVLSFVLLSVVYGVFTLITPHGGNRRSAGERFSLPTPRREGDVSVEEAIAARRSRRTYDVRALSSGEISQLLWAAQGVTDSSSGHRAAPSAGALYPLELYAVVGVAAVEGLDAGVYRYRPATHELELLERGDVREELRDAAIEQDPVGNAPIDIVVCSADGRTTGKYGERGARRYVPMEAGHVGENIYLQAESLGLSTVSVGAFGDEGVRELVGAPSSQRPLYIFPVGGRRRGP